MRDCFFESNRDEGRATGRGGEGFAAMQKKSVKPYVKPSEEHSALLKRE